LPLEQTFVAANLSLHDFKSFDCGKPLMNEFLARYAVKHCKLGLSRTYVLAEASKDSENPVAAYYTLASSTVVRAEIPARQSLPMYPVPVVMLARLAVNNHHQGQGLGAKTLVHALRQAANLSKAGLPAYGLILDVLDEQALKFYQHFEIFEAFTNDPMRLFVAMKTVEQI
jgi:GNAT superfamily N-acetyltransferase